MADKRVTDALKVVKDSVAALEIAIKTADAAALKPPKLVKPPMLLIGAGNPSGDSSDDFTIGVCTHMAFGHSRAATETMMNTLGVSSLRDEVFWDDFETSVGVFNKSALPSGIQDLLNGVVDASNSVLLLGYGSNLYDSGNRPRNSDTRTAFKNYCQAAMSAGGDRFGFVEVYNEWNLPQTSPDGVTGTAEEYAELLKVVGPALKGQYGNTKVISSGIVDVWTGTEWDDFEFIKTLIAEDCLQYLDGIGFHSYNWDGGVDSAPDHVDHNLYERLERLQEILTAANGGYPFPIYITEFGWPSHTGSGITEQLAGEWTTEFIAWMRTKPWIKGAWLYELRDSGTDAAEAEHNFGVFTSTGVAKTRLSYIDLGE